VALSSQIMHIIGWLSSSFCPSELFSFLEPVTRRESLTGMLLGLTTSDVDKEEDPDDFCTLDCCAFCSTCCWEEIWLLPDAAAAAAAAAALAK